MTSPDDRAPGRWWTEADLRSALGRRATFVQLWHSAPQAEEGVLWNCRFALDDGRDEIVARVHRHLDAADAAERLVHWIGASTTGPVGSCEDGVHQVIPLGDGGELHRLLVRRDRDIHEIVMTRTGPVDGGPLDPAAAMLGLYAVLWP